MGLELGSRRKVRTAKTSVLGLSPSQSWKNKVKGQALNRKPSNVVGVGK